MKHSKKFYYILIAVITLLLFLTYLLVLFYFKHPVWWKNVPYIIGIAAAFFASIVRAKYDKMK